MSLRTLRDRLSLGQVVIACATVAMGGGVRWFSLAIAAALALWAFARPLPDAPSRRAQRLWTLGVFVALALSIARAFLRVEFLDAGVDFLLLLVVQRLFNRQGAREHMQLMLLGALFMVIGAVINTGLNYPPLFVAYLLVTTMALLVNHLMAEGERLGPRVMHEVAREGVRRRRELWRAAAGVALLTGMGALVTFLVFPRFGVGVFLRGDFARSMRTGFASEVRLGVFGTVKDDATVVMHLSPITEVEAEPRLTWHLRGSSFDRYEDGLWSQSRRGESIGMRRFYGYQIFAPEGASLVERHPDRSATQRAGRVVPRAREIGGFARSTETLRVRVILDDIGTELLFAASEPLGVRLTRRGALERRMRVMGAYNRQMRLTYKPPGPVQYEFVSRIGAPSRDELLSVGNPRVPRLGLGAYLQRSDQLSPEITALAQRVTEGADTRIEKVEAVIEYLQTFGYTLELRASPRVEAGADPIEGFLFDTKEGHCEYFATAMAVLLREVGVPVRNVNGYYGAHRNQFGDFYVVRQADAHSWVEVNFGPLGWVTFDPTPPSGRLAGDDAPLWPAAAQMLDVIRSAYLNYVIDYNLGKQIAILEGLGLRRGGGAPPVPWRQRSWLLHLGWLVALAVLLRLAHRRRRTRQPPEVRIYGALLRTLARSGRARERDESSTRFARRLAREQAPEAAAFAAFASRYEDLRFGETVTPADLEELQRLAREVRRAR
jgi:hypothetical protein